MSPQPHLLAAESTPRASHGQELSGYLLPLGSNQLGQWSIGGPRLPINSCGRRRISKPTKASKSPSAERPRPVDVAESCGARWECGSGRHGQESWAGPNSPYPGPAC